MSVDTGTRSSEGRTGRGRVLVAGVVAGPVATEIVGRVLRTLIDQPARGWTQLGIAAAGITILIAARATRWFGIAAAAGVAATFGVGYLLAWWLAESLNALGR